MAIKPTTYKEPDEASEGQVAPKRHAAPAIPYHAPHDTENAKLFVKAYGDSLRYDHSRKCWFAWDKQRWISDADGGILRTVIEHLRKRASDAWLYGDPAGASVESKFITRSLNEKGLRSLIAIARSLKPIADDGLNWDKNPWLLGVANGVVDLRNGELREGQQDDRITKCSPVEFDPEAQALRWEQFLLEIFDGDTELIDYVQRAIGYSLTGATNEQMFFYCYGTGANGKGTFLETLQRAIGSDYAHVLDIQTLLAQRFRGISSDIANLEGKRFTICSEPKQGQTWSDDRLKLLTGEDTITARHLYQNERTFNPTHKIWMQANHYIATADHSLGFWRRIRVIPFNARFDGDARDNDLRDKLHMELPGVLAWAVRGAVKWRDKRLLGSEPKIIRQSTDQYRESCDGYSAFFSTECTFEKNAFTPSAEFIRIYDEWHRENPDAPDFGRVFWQRLKERGAQERITRLDGKKLRGYMHVSLHRYEAEKWNIEHPQPTEQEVLMREALEAQNDE